MPYKNPEDRKRNGVRRGKLWDLQFIPCKNHPSKKCMRAQFIQHNRLCVDCFKSRPSVQRYERSEKGIQKRNARIRKYNHSDKGRQTSKARRQTEEGKAVRRRYSQSEKGKATSKRARYSEKGMLARAWYEERKLHG